MNDVNMNDVIAYNKAGQRFLSKTSWGKNNSGVFDKCDFCQKSFDLMFLKITEKQSKIICEYCFDVLIKKGI